MSLGPAGAVSTGLLLLWAAGCAGPAPVGRSKGPPGDTASRGDSGPSGDTGDGAAPGAWVYGAVVDAFSRAPLPGVQAWDARAPGDIVTTGPDGRWALPVASAGRFRLASAAPGMLPFDAWISTAEAPTSGAPYAYALGSAAQLGQLAAQVGSSADLTVSGLIFVDAISPAGHDIGGATVALDAPYEGVYREVAPGEWEQAPLTTEDRADLLFLGVAPGPVALRVTSPGGADCDVPEDVVVAPERLIQVSAYCPDDAAR